MLRCSGPKRLGIQRLSRIDSRDTVSSCALLQRSLGEVASEVALTCRSGVLRVEASATNDSGAGSSADPLEGAEFTEDESDAESEEDNA